MSGGGNAGLGVTGHPTSVCWDPGSELQTYWLCHTFSSNPAAEVALMLWKPTKAPQTVLNVSILNVRCWHKYGIACNQQFSGILLKLEEAEPSVS